MSAISLSDDREARLPFRSTDAEGVETVDPAMTVTIDNPAAASLTADPDVPGDYIIRRLSGGDDSVTVNVTATVPPQENLGQPIVSTVAVTFAPGLTTAIVCVPVAEALTPAS